MDQWKLIFHVNISDKLESNIKKTVKNTEEQIHEDSGSLKLLQKIQNKNKKMNIDEIQDLGRLYKLIDYGMVNPLLNNEVSIYGIGVDIYDIYEIQNHDRGVPSFITGSCWSN